MGFGSIDDLVFYEVIVYSGHECGTCASHGPAVQPRNDRLLSAPFLFMGKFLRYHRAVVVL
jgi:hypothetical protein